jgi:hypothetical protein
MTRRTLRALALPAVTGTGLLAAGYAAAVSWNWIRYAHVPAARQEEWTDEWLDGLFPDYEILERHSIAVDAPFSVTFEAAKGIKLRDAPIARAIFAARERILGAQTTGGKDEPGILEETTRLGWRVLAEVPGREIVLGAVCRPWEADVTFRGLLPDEFRAFADPGYVKIAWTLRADPAGDARSIFRTETRARATSPDARRRFRWYWAKFSPGIVLIRQAALSPLKYRAEALAADRSVEKDGTQVSEVKVP